MSEPLNAASRSRDREALRATAGFILAGLHSGAEECRDEYVDSVEAILDFFYDGDESDAAWNQVDAELTRLQECTERS
jgi:hypothetical protein